MLLPTTSGLLLHPTSLPGRFGMGELGAEAEQWLVMLLELGHSVWEMQALGPTALSGSPGECLSGFAGNPLLISFDSLRQDGVLLAADIALLPHFADDPVDIGPAAEVRAAFLRLAAQRLLSQCRSSPLLGHAFEAFCDREAVWLDDWALFASLRHENDERPWQQWPSDIAARDSEAIADAIVRLEAEADEHRALQFLFHRQWQRLRAHAHAQGIHLIAELPLWPAPDSADAWAEPCLLDATAAMAEKLPWWQARLRHALRSVDAVRLAAGEVLPEALATALQAGYALPLPIVTAAPGLELAPSRSLRDALAGDATSGHSQPWAWRFTWAALTPEVRARLVAEGGRQG